MEKLGIWFTGLIMVLIALAGLKMAADADDLGMTIFGSGLFMFGVLFVFGLLKSYADHFYGADPTQDA